MRTIDPAPQIEIHPNIAELYRRRAADLQALLTNDADRPQAMELIRSMIDRIEVSEGEKRGKPAIRLVGALAFTLEFATADANANAAPRRFLDALSMSDLSGL